ncbi:hypothetical protein MLD38_001861 [Melastoma candidum]|uniref:Uncharacterized protein n=1 Tax=Melastoma candidum TaxID=119954 RepID=A0ACB9SFK3_9MYRT|nr:hypothetical protein MLD38_001861 [Melastoma candidum]
MASIAPQFNSRFLLRLPSHGSGGTLLISSGPLRGSRRYDGLCCCVSSNGEFPPRTQTPQGFKERSGSKRREVVLLQLAFSSHLFLSPGLNAFADETGLSEDLRVYVDDANKFKISIPQDWTVGTGEPTGFKSVTAFFPGGDSSCNVSVAITGIGPDFTTLGSFGKVDEFAETLVNGLDRSWKRPPGVAAKLINCKDANGFYYIEYSLQNPGETKRHIYSALGMASNGWYNRLYTVTGQYPEEEEQAYSSKIQKAVASFRFI